ncbi:hypothetical protein [Flavobacterium silvaticum]|uniref:DUF3379 domain-containing protein n=1 Tax=Flavobacterium silvaticum TaxID=1852020 RepID=A0A972FQ28_9FLAO|nr:hypothetical protein [Flavobacterium silvaticum]NMH27319.1 hypothetical protein [Flavobacterium silvaticum]
MKEFKLDETKKINIGFKTPEGYFDSLEDRIMQRINELPEAKETRIIPLYRRKIWMYATAAMIVIALGTAFFLEKSVDDVPDHEVLENYLAYQTSLNQFDLLNVLDTEDIRAIQTELPVEDKDIEAFISDNPDFEPILTE